MSYSWDTNQLYANFHDNDDSDADRTGLNRGFPVKSNKKVSVCFVSCHLHWASALVFVLILFDFASVNMRWEFSRKVGEPMKSQFDIGESAKGGVGANCF